MLPPIKKQINLEFELFDPVKEAVIQAREYYNEYHDLYYRPKVDRPVETDLHITIRKR